MGRGGEVIKNPQLQHKQDDKYDIGDWQWGKGGGRAVTEQICSETQNKSALKTTFNLPPSFASGRSFPSWPGSYKQPLKGEMRTNIYTGNYIYCTRSPLNLYILF
jgi:hypothetical protein